MMLVNGISLGITDQNPISSAFVLSVVVMAAFGMKDPITGLLAASIVFDHFGWIGFAVHPASLWRVLGAAFMILGVGLVALF